jgi:hypothetical protein
MSITILSEQRETAVPSAQADGESLWLGADDIERALGWTWKPEGLCRDDTCVPLRRTGAVVVREDRLDIAALWRHMGNPVVHDEMGGVWVFGIGSVHRTQMLAGGEAPDFALPDLQGSMHKLSDFRGKKVLLATWASW